MVSRNQFHVKCQESTDSGDNACSNLAYNVLHCFFVLQNIIVFLYAYPEDPCLMPRLCPLTLSDVCVLLWSLQLHVLGWAFDVHHLVVYPRVSSNTRVVLILQSLKKECYIKITKCFKIVNVINTFTFKGSYMWGSHRNASLTLSWGSLLNVH